jgi:hypothetical protein
MIALGIGYVYRNNQKAFKGEFKKKIVKLINIALNDLIPMGENNGVVFRLVDNLIGKVNRGGVKDEHLHVSCIERCCSTNISPIASPVGRLLQRGDCDAGARAVHRRQVRELPRRAKEVVRDVRDGEDRRGAIMEGELVCSARRSPS